jgi:ATP/maltotriose-dependent transcriptional regulator MalT
VLSTYAGTLMIRGEYEESRRRCEAALSAAPDEDSWERSHALAVLGVDLVNQGDVTGALEALDEAMAISRRLDDPEAAMRIYVNRSYSLETVGRYQEAAAFCDEGLAYAERKDMYVVAGALLLGNKASALIAAGALREARTALSEAIVRPGPPVWLLYAQLRLAEVEIGLGELASAQRRLTEATGADLSTDSVVETQFRLVQAMLALAGSEPEAAYQQAQAELARDHGGTEPSAGLHLYAVGLRGLALAAARRTGEDVAERADELMKAAGVLRDQAPLAPCQDLFDLCSLEYRECLSSADPEDWSALADRFAAGGRNGLAPYAYYRAATSLLTASGRKAAWPPLRAAWRLLEPLGDVPLAREVAALAATCRLDLAVPVPRGEARPAQTPFGLTPREVEVLGLVCDGATNRQIARALTISERTAGVHVSNILAKLQARNRAEAIAIAHRTGALPTSS